MNYLVTDFYKIDIDLFKENISKGEIFDIFFPLSSIGFTNSRLDIIQDYITVSFCCERIAPYIEVFESKFINMDKYYKDFYIRCKAIDVESLTDNLSYCSEMLTHELKQYDDIDVISFYDEISDYEGKIETQIYTFPELINNYWANLINGAYWEIASENYDSEEKFFNKIYRKYPEHRFGFWKGARSVSFMEPIYFSTENWIIPPKTDVQKALKAYSGIDRIHLEDADIVNYNGKTILLTNSAAVYFNRLAQFSQSLICTEFAIKKKLNKKSTSLNNNISESRFDTDLFGEQIISKTKRNRISNNKNIEIEEHNVRYQLSEFGDIIAIEYLEYTYIFFSTNFLNFEEIKELNSYLFPAFAKTQNLIDISISEKCDWTQLDDGSFEELCYDILFCHPLFDSTTIQKMGKSKSRDGGRDITIKTKKTPTSDSVLYIFQCKLYSDKTSLSASKLPNAGNVIMQYGAKGYGVFTTTVIDSTLCDMLEGFTLNMGINTSFRWSKYELERYLNRYQMIKNKYFSK